MGKSKVKWDTEVKKIDSKLKPSRVAWFTKTKSGKIIIQGYDQDVAMVIYGDDLKQLLMMIPYMQDIDETRKLMNK